MSENDHRDFIDSLTRGERPRRPNAPLSDETLESLEMLADLEDGRTNVSQLSDDALSRCIATGGLDEVLSPGEGGTETRDEPLQIVRRGARISRAHLEGILGSDAARAKIHPQLSESFRIERKVTIGGIERTVRRHLSHRWLVVVTIVPDEGIARVFFDDKALERPQGGSLSYFGIETADRRDVDAFDRLINGCCKIELKNGKRELVDLSDDPS